MDEQQQADVVDKMIRSAGKFNGTGFNEWYDQAMDCFRLRCRGILSIIAGQQCPEPKYHAVRLGRSLVRERRRQTDIAKAAEAVEAAEKAASKAAAAAEAAEKAGDSDEEAQAASSAAAGAASRAAETATTLAEELETPAEASSEVSVPFTYSSATELPTSVLWDIPRNVTNRDEIREWHVDNMMLGTFLSICTTGAAKKFVATFKPKPDMLSNGILAWKALVKKYRNPSRNPSRQRQKILFKKLYSMTMDVDQDPDAFMHDMSELRDELQLLGSPIPDDQFMNIILDCLPAQLYSGIKYEAETREDLTLEQALYTMRNLYINRKEESGTSRASATKRDTSPTSASNATRNQRETLPVVGKANGAPYIERHVMTTLLAVNNKTGTAAATSKVVSSKDATKVIATTGTGTTTGISSAVSPGRAES